MLRTAKRVLVAGLLAAPDSAAQARGEWGAYGRDPGGSRFSPLTQITRDNVVSLRVVWTFKTGEAGLKARDGATAPAFEATPLMVAGKLYISTPGGQVISLDAGSGKVSWRFDAGVNPKRGYGDFANRGVSYWEDRRAPAGQRCARRIYFGSIDARLLALDADNGRPCEEFGDRGTIDLRQGLRTNPFEFQAYQLTSPPAVVGDLLVVGSAIGDNSRMNPASGEVRAYDARTGRLRWTFDPIPQDPTSPVASSWRDWSGPRTGGANVWSVMVADPENDLVFLPTTSPAPDYYGAKRLGDNRYANSLVALRASTGAVVWHFQTVHHDLWDYDNASPPALTTIRTPAGNIPAVIQTTKTGMMFVLDRRTGTAIFPVVEREVSKSDVPDEEAWPTQPYGIELWPGMPEPWGASAGDREWCRERMSSLRYDGPFTPPSTRGTLVIPSNIGGAHWGGVAIDARRRIAVVPVNRVAAVVQLLPSEGFNRDSLRKDDTQRGVQDYEYTRMESTPYIMRRRIMIGPSGLPCTAPPFGGLVGVSLDDGRVIWRSPLGNMPAGDKPTTSRSGAVNLGGPLATAAGVVFIGATIDRAFRAYDVESGRELWQVKLPAGARSTPMTYEIHGKQYVAIAAGGGSVFGTGDELVVFALP
jgi:quinoprotein glucose dehydrogenase